MKEIKHFLLPQQTNQLYKNEAVSSISLTKEVAEKINELVDAYNEVSKFNLGKMQEQDGKIRKGILYMKDNLANTLNDLMDVLIERGIIDERINLFIGNIKQRVNNLVGSIVEGSTTMDAEIIDARLGQDNILYKSLGESIRKQFSYTNLWRSVKENNCDACVEVGHYFIGSGVEWKNVPGPIQAGVLITYNGGAGTRIYQQFQNYYGELYLRNQVNGAWSEWKAPGNNETSFSLKTGTAGLESCDLNNVLEMGAYRLSSANVYQNSPSVAGLLLVYGTASPNQVYQMFISFDNQFYMRSLVNGYFYDWVKLAQSGGEISSTVNESKNYIIQKVDSEHLNIYKKGVKGYIKYQYGKQVDSSINLNAWRLLTIDLCDLNKNVIKQISTIGADLEGVILLDGNSDHVGGVHGDEVATGYFLFVDGKQYTFDSVVDMDCNIVQIIVDSNIYNQDSSDLCFKKNKQVVFDENGIHINCKWKAMKELLIDSIRSCMFSIQKECFTHYYDSNVNTTPIEVSNSTTSDVLFTDENINDIYYIGDVTAHHWAGKRGGNSENYSTLIQDYGFRLKSYFNCYDNYKTKVNEELKAENNFKISC